MTAQLISIGQASQIIAAKVPDFAQPPSEEIKLGQLQRVLAEDVYSTICVPDFDNSAMDGYVLYREDLLSGAPLPLDSQEAAAGSPPTLLSPGRCRPIYTGAPLPLSSGGELVIVPLENCEQSAGQVRPDSSDIRHHIRPKGQNYRKGELVAAKGALCRPELFSVLAAVGRNRLKVYQPLRLALCSSGDELVPAGQGPLQPGQIYDSNSIYLACQCQQLGWQTQVIHLPDDYSQTQEQLRQFSRDFDVVLCSGGASVGERDFIQRVVQEEGEVYIRKIAVKPGKPFTFANFYGRPLFCLPGNPLAVYVGFLYFVLPFLRRLQGQNTAQVRLERVAAPCDLPAAARTQFVFCRRQTGVIRPLAEQSSALLKYQYLADGALIVPAGVEAVREGQALDWFSFRAQLW